MKRNLKLLGLFLICMLLFVTGCGKENNNGNNNNNNNQTNEISKITDAMNKYDSGRMEMIISMGMEAEGMSLDMNMNMDMKYNKNITYTKSSVEFFGQTMETETYTVITGNKIAVYVLDPTDNTWSKEETDYKEEDSQNNYDVYLKNYKSVEEITNENLVAGTKGYKITISKEDAKALLNSGDDSTFDEVIEITGDLIIKVYVNNKYEIEKMVADFNNIFTSKDESVNISKLIMTVNYKDLGKVDAITVPQAALNAQ